MQVLPVMTFNLRQNDRLKVLRYYPAYFDSYTQRQKKLPTSEKSLYIGEYLRDKNNNFQVY